MLKNYITDADLQKFYPNIQAQLSKNISSYSDTIEQAYEGVLSDMYNKGLNPRQLMIPLTLVENTSTAGTNQKRLVVEVGTVDGEWSISLDGSNDGEKWVAAAFIDGISVATTYTVKFTTQYKYYRYTKVATVAGSLSETVSLVETNFDILIAYKALTIAFRSMIKENGDNWHVNAELTEKDYENAIMGVRFYIDSNDNGVIDVATETPTKIWNMTLSR